MTVAECSAVHNGYGDHIKDLTHEQVVRALKVCLPVLENSPRSYLSVVLLCPDLLQDGCWFRQAVHSSILLAHLPQQHVQTSLPSRYFVHQLFLHGFRHWGCFPMYSSPLLLGPFYRRRPLHSQCTLVDFLFGHQCVHRFLHLDSSNPVAPRLVNDKERKVWSSRCLRHGCFVSGCLLGIASAANVTQRLLRDNHPHNNIGILCSRY
jgi:hypothetical protein